MKVGYVIRSLEDSGVTVYVLRLASAMRERGHEVFLVSDGGVYENEVAELGLRRIALPLCRNPLTSYRAARRLVDIVRREKPDILHANWRRAQFACHLATKRLGTPFVSTLHLVGIPDSWLYRRLSHWGRHVFSPCTEGRVYLHHRFGVPLERISVVHHGADPDKWPQADDEAQRAARQSLGLPEGTTVLTCVARLEKIKRHDLLLEAVAAAGKSGADMSLLLVGSGAEEASLKRLADRLGIADAVRFLGYTDPRTALVAADAFVLASDRESFGIAPVEAMLTGRAVIRTDSEGARDQVTAGETGEIVPRGDAAALARAIGKVSHDRDRWREMGRRASAYAREHFTLSAMAEKVERSYLDCLQPVADTLSVWTDDR